MTFDGDETGVLRGPRASTLPKPLALVLLPPDSAFDPVFLAVAAACTEAGFKGKRLDRNRAGFDEMTMMIEKADVVVADLTADDPTVVYETGYAHARGKTTVLLSQRASKLTDLQTFEQLAYTFGQLDVLSDQLTQRLRWIKQLLHARKPLDLEIRGLSKVNGRFNLAGDVTLLTRNPRATKLKIVISAERVTEPVRLGPLVVSYKPGPSWTVGYVESNFEAREDQRAPPASNELSEARMHDFLHELGPGESRLVWIGFHRAESTGSHEEAIPIALRWMTGSKPIDQRFNLRLRYVGDDTKSPERKIVDAHK